MQNVTLTSTLKPVKHRENNILTLLFPLSPFLHECATQEKRNQYTTFFSSHASASYLYTYTKFTYSLSWCRLLTFVLGPFLLGGGDTSTTSGDGGGSSTTSGDELIDMTSSSLQHKIMNIYYILYKPAQFKLKSNQLTTTSLTNLLMLTGYSAVQCKEQ